MRDYVELLIVRPKKVYLGQRFHSCLGNGIELEDRRQTILIKRSIAMSSSRMRSSENLGCLQDENKWC